MGGRVIRHCLCPFLLISWPHRVFLGARRSCLCWPGWRRHKPVGGFWRGRWAFCLMGGGGFGGVKPGWGTPLAPTPWREPAWFGSVPAGGGGEEVGTGEAGARHSSAGAGTRLPPCPRLGEHPGDIWGGNQGHPTWGLAAGVCCQGDGGGLRATPPHPGSWGGGGLHAPPRGGGCLSFPVEPWARWGVVPRFAGVTPPPPTPHPLIAGLSCTTNAPKGGGWGWIYSPPRPSPVPSSRTCR